MGVDYPDSQFYGLNHLAEHGIAAEWKEIEDVVPRWLARFCGFRLRHLLLFFATGGYDIVFGASLVYPAMLRKVFPRRAQRFVLFSFNVVRTLRVHAAHPLRAFLYRQALFECDAIITLSTYHRDYITRHVPELADRVYMTALGVDTEYYTPTFANRRAYMLAVGRDDGRDYGTIVETARRLPEQEFHLVCAPRNIDGLGELPPNVRVFHNLPYPDLARKFAEARALLLILHPDTHPKGSDYPGQTVLLEAMAVGIPVIVSRQRYLDDYVRDGEDALLVDFYSPDGIAERIRELQRSPELGERIARNARKRAEKTFSSRAMAYRLAKLFRKVAGA